MDCAKTILFGRLLMMDCLKRSLGHCLGGQTQPFCSFWSGEFSRLLDKQQSRRLLDFAIAVDNGTALGIALTVL